MTREKMKSQFNKILIVTFVILFFTLSKSYSIEDVSEFTDAINEAREELNNVPEASTEQSKIIDEALKEIDKATEFVQEAINANNAEDAIKTLEFIEKSLSDVQNIIPKEFGSDMSKIDTTAMPKEDMAVITELTAQMKTSKEKKENDFMSDLVDLNMRGIDTISISENLNGLGIDTIKVVLDVDNTDKLETWTKEQWAASYKGSILTSVGTETITDKQIGNKVVDLEQQLIANNSAILEKRDSLAELQTKIDPLSNQITDLQSQKTNLLTKYNEEILKQTSTILSVEEANQSKKLADQLNNQLSQITNDIEVSKSQSNELQQQVQSINLELTNEIALRTQLENNIREINNQLLANQRILSQKTSELNNLKNTDLNKKVKDLNDRLEDVTLQRDFAQRDFDKAIDKEADAFQRYYSALGNVDADNYDIQAEYAVREVKNILNPDPKEYRAFELEKYSKLAGLSQDFINEGLVAIETDDWNKQKTITKRILDELEKNPQSVLPNGWYFGKSTDGDVNIMIAEDKAMQEAVYASIELNSLKEEVSSSIAEKTKDIKPLTSLNTVVLENSGNYYFSKSGTPEYDFLQSEYNKVVETDLGIKMNNLAKDLSESQKQLDQFMQLNQQRNEKIKNLTDKIQKSMKNDFAEMNELSSEIKELSSDLRSKQTAFINAQQTVTKEIIDGVRAEAAKIYDTVYANAPNIGTSTKKYLKALANDNINIYQNLATEGLEFAIVGNSAEVNNGFLRTKTKEWSNFSWGQQEKMWTDLKNLENKFTSLKNDQILKNEVFKNPQIVKLNNEINKLNNKQVLTSQRYNDLSKEYAEKSSKIMDVRLENQTTTEEWGQINDLRREITSISMEKNSIEREIKEIATKNLVESVNKAKTEYDQIVAEESKELTEYKNKISSILKEIPTFESRADSLVDLDPVSLRAKLVDLAGDGNINESAAVKVALEELGKIGNAPVSEYMKGPYWEASNIKTAAIVRSKKYSYVDDYDYMNAYYKDSLPLNSTDRVTLEGELKDVLGESNPVLDALNEKIANLTTEANLTKEQSKNITTEMTKLKNELSSLENSEKDLQSQIKALNNQFNSKESLINEKTKNLASIKEQLNPISEKMNELQGQRAELDSKLNDQLNTIANQVKNQEQVSNETNTLKAQYESQIAQLDNQIKEFENQSNEINSQLTSITKEISVLETKSPEIADQIASLNKDLDSFGELRADLAMATAKKLGINVDEKALKSVRVDKGKVVITIEGTNLVRVVGENMLIDQAEKFIDPDIAKLSINSKVYSAKALNRDLVTPEFLQASKTLPASQKVQVIAETSALQTAGSTTAQASEYAAAKAARLSARAAWDAATASGDKAAAKAAEDAFMAAKVVEQEAGLAAAAAVGAASSAATSAASAASAVAQDVAQDVAEAVEEASTEVAQAAADAGMEAQQAALDALWELEAMPGSSGMHTLEVTAAIRQVQAEMHGHEFDYMGHSSYEAAMAAFAEAEKAGKTQMDLVNEVKGNHDPNRMGKCGKASC